MRALKILAVVICFSAMPLVADQAFEPIGTTGVGVPPSPDSPMWDGPRAMLHDNGSFTSHFGTGVGGADESWTQSSLGMTTWGFGAAFANGWWMADQFTIPPGETWDITNVTVFVYQSFAGTTSTINGVYLRLWDGMPGAGTVVWGDDTTNVMSSTGWTNVYRVTDTDTGANSDRAIMANVADVSVSLGEGTYWVDFSCTGTASSGPWAPPIVIMGNPTTGDGLQSVDFGVSYAAVADNGSGTAQGFPFIVEGTVQGGGGGGGGGGGTGGVSNPIPTLSTTGIVVLILALIGISAVLIRRRM